MQYGGTDALGGLESYGAPTTVSSPLEQLGFASGGLFSLVATVLSMIMLPFIFIMIALVLYYFTGDKKRAEGFMPFLMSQLLRVYNYFWLFIISLVAYFGLQDVVSAILKAILPASKSFSVVGGDSKNEFDSQTFVKGIVLLILMALLAGFKVFLNRKSTELTKMGGSVSTKLFLATGLFVFSLLAFVSTLTSIDSILGYLYDKSDGVNSSSLAMMIASVTMLSLYLVKSWQVIKGEVKK